jgi:hypothetical protein
VPAKYPLVASGEATDDEIIIRAIPRRVRLLAQSRIGMNLAHTVPTVARRVRTEQ